MSTQGDRLKRIRLGLSKTQEEFGESLGISKQFYSNIETNRTLLNNDKLSILYKNYNVNLNYLVGGFGEPFRTKETKNLGKEILNDIQNILHNRGLL